MRTYNLDAPMEKLKQLLQDARKCKEHPVYHPEQTLNRHILIVLLRALLLTGNVDLIFAALFHDLFKSRNGKTRTLPDGRIFYSNYLHPKEGAAFVLEDENRYLIKSFKGNVDTVFGIVLNHMDCKKGLSKAGKKIPLMDTFMKLDDMIFRHMLPSKVGRVFGHDGLISFVGQSPIQQNFHSDTITITCNRYPSTLSFNRIPELFEHSDKYKDLAPLIALLKDQPPKKDIHLIK